VTQSTRRHPQGRKAVEAWSSPEKAREYLEVQLGRNALSLIEAMYRHRRFRLRCNDKATAENKRFRAARQAVAAIPSRLRSSLRAAGQADALTATREQAGKVAVFGTADDCQRILEALEGYERTGECRALEQLLRVPTSANIRTELIADVWRYHPEIRSPSLWGYIGIMLGIDDPTDDGETFRGGPRDIWKKALARTSPRIKGEAPAENR